MEFIQSSPSVSYPSLCWDVFEYVSVESGIQYSSYIPPQISIDTLKCLTAFDGVYLCVLLQISLSTSVVGYFGMHSGVKFMLIIHSSCNIPSPLI